MKDNWTSFWYAVLHPFKKRILHEAKNVWVEWWRWRRGECDEHQKGGG
jgi:hypothetical protein